MEEAAVVFAALRSTTPDDPKIQRELKEIKNTLPPASEMGLKKLFQNGSRRNLHRATLGFVAQMFQQIGGINIVTYVM